MCLIDALLAISVTCNDCRQEGIPYLQFVGRHRSGDLQNYAPHLGPLPDSIDKAPQVSSYVVHSQRVAGRQIPSLSRQDVNRCTSCQL
jgi:hypothetical protein